jgi:alkanesulfonate monooxygenase SsuD/methylene tetrahydromethanopterin reductase-like flavin-dependent oxidoreductase (luciferase family)
MRAAGPTAGLMLATVANLDTGQTEPARVIEAARRAEAGGFDGVYVGDHLLHPHPLLESIVTLSAVAASTERVSLGPCVLLVALRHPVVLAKQLGTLAAFAPGRLRVGVGVGGEYAAEFDAMDVPLARRGRQMESALRQVRSLLRAGVDRPDVTMAPGAAAVPFLLAGHQEAPLRRAATYGDGWIGYLLGPDSFGRRRAFIRECREEQGQGDEPFITGMLIPVYVDVPARAPTRAPARAPTRAPARAPAHAQAQAAAAWARLTGAATGLPERLFVAGRPADIVAQLHRYWEAGCTEFVLAPADHGRGYLDQVDLIGQEVLPGLREFS